MEKHSQSFITAYRFGRPTRGKHSPTLLMDIITGLGNSFVFFGLTGKSEAETRSKAVDFLFLLTHKYKKGYEKEFKQHLKVHCTGEKPTPACFYSVINSFLNNLSGLFFFSKQIQSEEEGKDPDNCAVKQRDDGLVQFDQGRPQRTCCPRSTSIPKKTKKKKTRCIFSYEKQIQQTIS